ncbi:hypothetical protein FAZ19_14830 [Sphingobacterium alkalisoli]|uniref:Uncharacterized protein n=1 Tax=Sphingobacterium alkalisoli TaxID=1874115 RepID=A0A4U0GZ12_9SPHI|nr:YiiX/YebB-like N1pC/P60 family cysteine hydrolase [Sphingobacterium alkalisoli]TJY64470.1 hypothetical protein FAZ19_14830 [Sphingobacterium alkalisoli]GGH21553.1 hypothetical protein GCM10011418_27500 [Sphingobacterium alkalisoli]
MKKFLFGMFCLLFIQQGYGQQIDYRDIKNGDLIFVGAEKENLSGAINRVTQQSKDIAFDHVALLEIDNDSLFVLHASGKKGTVRESFWDFVRNQKKDSQQLAIFRLTEEYATSIPTAIQQAKKLLGKPYNYTYVLNDSSLYCSDYIERIFRTRNVFTLQPMTFVNPETGTTDAHWKTFYEKQGMEIPEGKLGCNPNGLAQSPHVSFIGNINLATHDSLLALRDSAILLFHTLNLEEAEGPIAQYYAFDQQDTITQNILREICISNLKKQKDPYINYKSILAWETKYPFTLNNADIQRVLLMESIKLGMAAFDQNNFEIVERYYRTITTTLSRSRSSEQFVGLANLDHLIYNYGLHTFYAKDFKKANRIFAVGNRYFPSDVAMKKMLTLSKQKLQ